MRFDAVSKGARELQAGPRLTKLPEEAQVAQLVEQRTENPRVGGSNPPLGTTPFHSGSASRV